MHYWVDVEPTCAAFCGDFDRLAFALERRSLYFILSGFLIVWSFALPSKFEICLMVGLFVCSCCLIYLFIYLFFTDFTTTSTTTAFVAPFPSCNAHASCKRGKQFCAVQCWTGGCGADGTARRGTLRNFCQPCVECQKVNDSVTGKCNICNFSGKINAVELFLGESVWATPQLLLVLEAKHDQWCAAKVVPLLYHCTPYSRCITYFFTFTPAHNPQARVSRTQTAGMVITAQARTRVWNLTGNTATRIRADSAMPVGESGSDFHGIDGNIDSHRDLT